MDLFLAVQPGKSKRVQIEQQLRDGIRSGRLRGGMALPPSRTLAADLGVSRGVVVDAYAQLTAEGYLLARPRAGTRVSEGMTTVNQGGGEVAERLPPIRYEMRSGTPDPAAFPRRAWQSATVHALRGLPDADFLGPHRGGLAQLRIALADYVARARAAAADPERVVISSGLAPGLAVLLEVLAARGARRVAVEDPSWPHHARAVHLAGLQPVPVAVDGRGLVIDRLDADVVITTPAHQFPTGVVLAPERRAELIAWAAKRDTLVIEDDYDAEYRYGREPVAALQGMAPEHVVYAGTVSKTLAPTLRIGWLVLPAHLADDVAHRSQASGAWPSIIEQATLATMIQRGDLEHHLRAMRRCYRRRRDTLVDALSETFALRIGGAAAGLHLIAWPPEGTDVNAIAAQAREQGIALDTLHYRCWVQSPSPPALLLGYAAIPEHALRQAVRILARLPAAAPMLLAARPRP